MDFIGKITDEEIKANILFKLHWKKKWGSSHTSFENVKRGIPSHLRGKYSKIGKDLIREKLIIAKPTHYGLEISLNPKKRKTIIEFIRAL